ncbi:MAG: branched-chain amino acid ABC transporter permease [Actinomycetota bacterium]
MSEAELRRRIRLGAWGAAGFLAIVLPFVLPAYWSFVLVSAVTTSIVALSIVVLTGLVGQISLCQATFVGFGAYASARLTGDANVPFLIALPLSGLAAVPIGLLAGVPALRLRGLYLAIATLGFGAAVQATIFGNSTITGGISGVSFERPKMFGLDFAGDRSFYFLALAVLVLLIVFTVNVRRGKTGRAFAAIRDGEVAAAASGVSLARYKMMAFALSAFFAGVGGALFGHATLSVNSSSFDVFQSITFVTITIIAGVGSVAGALLAGMLLNIMPKALSGILPGNILLVILSTLLLVQLAVAPEGIVGQMRQQEDAVVRWILRRRGAPDAPAPVLEGR